MKGSHFYSDASIADLYAWFATETASSSPIWARLCSWIADTEAMWPILDSFPGIKRQPNVFLAALRYLDAPLTPGTELLQWVQDNRDRIRDVVLARDTQTNEPGRCANLAPVLGGLGDRIALVEVGMSAGLCLFPDRYGYRWRMPDSSVINRGPDDVTVIECAVDGSAPTQFAEYAVPNVVWRAGIDLNPLDPADEDDARWLRSLIWPGQTNREQRLAAALRAAAGEQLLRVRGDLLTELPAVVEQAPHDATVVVMHTAVLSYVERTRRAEFEQLMADLPVRWLANEGERVLPTVKERVPRWDGDPSFVMSLDGVPLARTGPHGQFLHWL